MKLPRFKRDKDQGKPGAKTAELQAESFVTLGREKWMSHRKD
jgi:hypothetical protein